MISHREREPGEDDDEPAPPAHLAPLPTRRDQLQAVARDLNRMGLDLERYIAHHRVRLGAQFTLNMQPELVHLVRELRECELRVTSLWETHP